MDHLALQVRGVDDVVVDEPDLADPGGRQVQPGRRPEAARAEQEHLRVEHLHLPLEADLGNEDVARVALLLLRGERARRDDGEAAVAPEGDAAGHRADVLVAEVLGEGLGGQRRADPGGAVEDDPPRTVGHELLET